MELKEVIESRRNCSSQEIDKNKIEDLIECARDGRHLLQIDKTGSL